MLPSEVFPLRQFCVPSSAPVDTIPCILITRLMTDSSLHLPRGLRAEFPAPWGCLGIRDLLPSSQAPVRVCPLTVIPLLWKIHKRCTNSNSSNDILKQGKWMPWFHRDAAKGFYRDEAKWRWCGILQTPLQHQYWKIREVRPPASPSCLCAELTWLLDFF